MDRAYLFIMSMNEMILQTFDELNVPFLFNIFLLPNSKIVDTVFMPTSSSTSYIMVSLIRVLYSYCTISSRK